MHPPARIEEARRLLARGSSPSEVGRLLGIPRSTVRVLGGGAPSPTAHALSPL